ncbi:E3 ubiquitin-protein ligase TRIM21-like [Anarrhichthys ocellatus]|uniref:E3 ubiquitin-protein ligase TRIM21-like n=1 Tax=Anarrhichthys ocellatus TaxID=433405 RepID=UPI0012EDCFD0|nr:E3 ubiquitin-protein ligase TRIM21-like [Anarrhichthys ocellatus]
MSTDNYLPTEEQLTCCICLEVFNDPVTLPCGHNFCKKCITHHLSSNSQHQCPLCKERVDRKYKLRVNTIIAEMVLMYRMSAGRRDRRSSEQQVAEPGEVSCDIPTETKQTTLKFNIFLVVGLACLTIYITIYLELHKTVSSPITPQLCDVVENVAGSLCPKHGKPLELYCKNEQMPICQSCAESSHRSHDIVPLKEEYEVKMKELQKTEAEIQQKIQERQLKIQEVKHWVWVSKEAADREMADGAQVFTALIQTLEKYHAKFIGMIEAKHKMTEKQVKCFTEELEQELSELMERRTEVEQLSRSKDHLHFFQSYPFFKTAPLAGDLPDVNISSVSYEGLLRTAVGTAVFQLIETDKNEMEKLQEAEPLNLWGNELDVTLDPDTANPYLILSDDGRQVHYSAVRNKVPDNSKRFDTSLFVLGKQSFSFGRFYYDVQVKGKTGWVIGVAKESVNRKGKLQLNPEHGIWALQHWQGDQYIGRTSKSVRLSVNDQIENVRVFVDYEKGLVSFYNGDSAALIFSFTGCSFTEKLHPIFCPSFENSLPLIMSPAVRFN